MERQYTLFIRHESGMPKLVTTAHWTFDDLKGRPFALVAHIPYNAKPNGLPQDGQLNEAIAIEDEIIKSLQPYNALHMGHITYNGSLRAIFHASEPSPQTLTIRKGLFGKITVPIDCREDRELTLIDLELKPTPLEAEESRNRQLLQLLASKGDIASKPRPVDFAAKFPSADKREAFVSAVAAEGYLPSPKPYWEPGPGSFWCELVKTTTLEPNVIGHACLYLREQARSVGGEFDGWQTSIMP